MTTTIDIDALIKQRQEAITRFVHEVDLLLAMKNDNVKLVQEAEDPIVEPAKEA